MTACIALIRGINVGGRQRMAMPELVAVFEAAGCRDVATVIQSGNVVFRHPAAGSRSLQDSIGRRIERHFGFLPGIVYLRQQEFRQAMAANPFPAAEAAPDRLHLWFTHELPTAPDSKKMQSLAARGENVALVGRVLYLHAPEGIGRSKLAAAAERLLGVAATARNWRTVTRIAALAGIEDT